MMRIALLLAVLAGQAHADHWIDMPAWPKPTPAVGHLRWLVAPQQITLEVEADGITRAIVLEPLVGEAHEAPLGKSEVSRLAFDQGGYVVKRTGDALTVLARDGARDKQIAKLHVPAKMKLDTH